MVAAELGDFDPGQHGPALISEFRFVQNQNEEFELDVLEAYKKSRGQTPAQVTRLRKLHVCSGTKTGL